jgi:hypothetical protein
MRTNQNSSPAKQDRGLFQEEGATMATKIYERCLVIHDVAEGLLLNTAILKKSPPPCLTTPEWSKVKMINLVCDGPSTSRAPFFAFFFLPFFKDYSISMRFF